MTLANKLALAAVFMGACTLVFLIAHAQQVRKPLSSLDVTDLIKAFTAGSSLVMGVRLFWVAILAVTGSVTTLITSDGVYICLGGISTMWTSLATLKQVLQKLDAIFPITVGERPGSGSYSCTSCGWSIRLVDSLPPCGQCSLGYQTTYNKTT